MSQITTIYTALLAQMALLYPELDGWQRIANPYKPNENPDTLLRQGWGIALGAGLNTNRLVNCKYSLNREITIVFTRKYDALENDPVNKAITEVQLFEDQHKLINQIEQDPTISDTLTTASYGSDGGIEYVKGETDSFMMLRTVIPTEYLEGFTALVT